MKPITTIIIAVLFSVMVSYGVVQTITPVSSEERAAKKESVYDRVMRTGTIRCGYVPLEPTMKKDANTGELGGISYDLVNILADKLSLKIEWAGEVMLSSMTQDIINGRYDMICSALTMTGPRARAIDALNPVFFQSAYAFVRHDDDRFGNDAALLNDQNITFSAIDGSTGQVITHDYFPNAKMVNLPEMSAISEALLYVQTKKADAVLMPAYEGFTYADNNQNALKAIGAPVFMAPFSFMIAQDEFRFKSMIEAALEELRFNGTIERIVKKYEKYPDTIFPSRSSHAPIAE